MPVKKTPEGPWFAKWKMADFIWLELSAVAKVVAFTLVSSPMYPDTWTGWPTGSKKKVFNKIAINTGFKQFIGEIVIRSAK